MTERLSNAELEVIVNLGACGMDLIDPENMATEILELRADAETSQNHNASVIDRIVEQLREAGYTGTLSEMVTEVIATARGDYNGL